MDAPLRSPEPSVRPFDDPTIIRDRVLSGVRDAYRSSFPIQNTQYRVELDEVDYDPPDDLDSLAQKRAILSGRTLSRALHGSMRMIDQATGEVVDRRRVRLADVPVMTDRGTFVYRGNDYTLANQLRLRPGVFARRRDNGELESHFNIESGGGPSFRIYLEPDSGKFRMQVGQASIPLYPVLRAAGASDRQIAQYWGNELLNQNRLDDSRAVDKVFLKLTGAVPNVGTDRAAALQSAMSNMRLDPDVVEMTLGRRADRVDPDLVLAATGKLKQILSGEAETDDRDNVAFQRVMGPEDLIAERVRRDAGGTMRRALWQSTFRRSLDPLSRHYHRTGQIESVLLNSGLSQAAEESNPLEIVDQMSRVSRMGPGGITDTDAIPDEARAAQPSFLGFIDPIRTTESEKVGVDNRLAWGAVKGDDGQLYSRMVDRNGRMRYVSARDAARATVAFPGERQKAAAENRDVRAMRGGKMMFVRPDDVDFEIPSPENELSGLSHLVPLVSAVKGHRMLMVARMLSQALPLDGAEAPLVQSLTDDDRTTFQSHFGRWAGAVRSDLSGRVAKVTPTFIEVVGEGGRKRFPVYDNLPLNRRTFLHNTPTVQVGQTVEQGDLLARSNFTDVNGDLAVGRNLRVGYLGYKGLTYEDAVAISESAARKLSSEHAYQIAADVQPDEHVSKSRFVAKFPGLYSKQMLDRFDDNGVIRAGHTVNRGDPLILSVRQLPHKGRGVLHHSAKDRWVNASRVWEYDSPGTVTDVHADSKTFNVAVRTYHPMQVGDKLTPMGAAKGVVSAIIPDAQMPHDEEGRPLEVLMQPHGVGPRTNPNMVMEAALGKIAAKTGKPYKLRGFSDDSFVDFVERELKRHGIKSEENLYDPEANRRIPNVFTGVQYFLKLAHRSEDKIASRGDEGGYTIDRIPAKIGQDASKRIGGMETAALLSSGATEVLRDAKLYRGQRNDDFWRAMRMGYTPPTPEAPFVYRKFFDDLVAAGINVDKKGNHVYIMPLTDRETDKRSRGEIKSFEMLDDKMDPVKDGLFDLGLTGGHSGTGWAHISLPEPMPNPIAEEPIRHLLGMTEKQFRDVLAGKQELNGRFGGEAIRSALQQIKVRDEANRQKETIRVGAKSRRDAAVKKLRVLDMLERTGIKPDELMLTKVPVLPPQYRPIRRMGRTDIVSDPNLLYKELMLARDNMIDADKELGREEAGDARLTLYDTFKSLTGLVDPIQPQLQSKSVRGILAHALGLRHSPKFGDVQRKLIGSSTGMVGRGVIVPDPSLDMDQVGLPEEQAWKLYRPFVIRELTRNGSPAMQAVRMTAERDPVARKALIREMSRRPVIVNRAPSLHRYSIMAAMPVLTRGDVLRVSPLTTSGFGADFDGDTMQFHVPVSDEAVQEAVAKLLPSRHLLHVRDFDVHYLPAQEFLHGLYEATDQPSDRPVRRFRSENDVVAAFRRGDIDLNDPIELIS